VAAILESKFGAMASAAHLILVDPAQGAEDYGRRRLAELERRWSRFLPASDVSRLNSAPEAWMLVSADTLVLLATMKQAWELTHGRYDPTMLAAILDAGYAASIDGSGRRSRMADRQSRGFTVEDVAVDPAASAVVVPAGVGLDPGGIGKGLAADLVVTELLAGGTAGALLSVGGDLAAAGTPPSPGGWLVAVEDPRAPTSSLLTLSFEGGGIATSSQLSRTWLQDGRHYHHAIDPATGASSTTDLATVTVLARTGWEAEAHATAALLCGGELVMDYLAARELEGIAVALDGTIAMSAGLQGAHVAEGSIA
jgi:thiamine biosynthesis lipoprotein